MSLLEAREIRLFVASPFDDLRDERRYLTSHVFPRLRSDAEAIGYSWSDVELRWGIPLDSSPGAVWSACRDALASCRHVLGLIGAKAGRPIEGFREELVGDLPGLSGRTRVSFTELELRYALEQRRKRGGEMWLYL